MPHFEKPSVADLRHAERNGDGARLLRLHADRRAAQVEHRAVGLGQLFGAAPLLVDRVVLRSVEAQLVLADVVAILQRDRRGDLLAELKRRHVFRVMAGYGIFSSNADGPGQARSPMSIS